MGRLLLIPLMPALLLVSLTLTVAAEETSDGGLKTPQEKLSYMLGMDVGASIKRLDTEVDLTVFMQAVEHVIKGQETLLTPEQAREIKQTFMQQRQEEAAATRKVLAEKNLGEGEAFLAQNGKKEGVETTESGLQYQVLKEGDGPKPKAEDQVTVHYRGTLLDGTEFDSSYGRGQPVTFELGSVIAGWTEGLQLMPVGSTYKFFIPPKLGYGERGAGGRIGPNATLIFEVELLKIGQ